MYDEICLLQAMPCCATLSETAADIASWQITDVGTTAVGEILAAVLAAEESARRAVVQDGSWDAAVQRVR